MPLMFDFILNDSKIEVAEFMEQIRCYDFIGPVSYSHRLRNMPNIMRSKVVVHSSLKEGEMEEISGLIKALTKEWDNE